jgi:hypothetical protein
MQINDHFNNTFDLELKNFKLNSNNMKNNNLEEITKILGRDRVVDGEERKGKPTRRI